MCKCCERNLRRGMSGKFRGEFIPCWFRQDLKSRSNVAVYLDVAIPQSVVVSCFPLTSFVKQPM